jgi:hypothetical protein
VQKFDYFDHQSTLEQNRRLLAPGNILRTLRPYFAFDNNNEAVVLNKGDVFLVLGYSEMIIKAPILDRMQINVEVLYREKIFSLEMFFVENTDDPWKKVYFEHGAVLVPNLYTYFTIFYTADDIDLVY